MSNNHKVVPYSMDHNMRNYNKKPGFVGYDEFEERVYGDVNNLDKILDKIEIDFGMYNFLNYSNKDLVENFNKCIEIKKLFKNTLIFGTLEVYRTYKPDILELISKEFSDVNFKFFK